MEEQLVSFETAKLAKEKGFNESCIRGYLNKDGSLMNDDDHFDYNSCYDDHSIMKHLSFKNSEVIDDYSITAPTQSFLQKWLREVHNLIVIIDWGPLSKKYSYEIYHNGKDYGVEYVNDSYEEALEEGLIEALKLIQQQ